MSGVASFRKMYRGKTVNKTLLLCVMLTLQNVILIIEGTPSCPKFNITQQARINLSVTIEKDLALCLYWRPSFVAKRFYDENLYSWAETLKHVKRHTHLICSSSSGPILIFHQSNGETSTYACRWIVLRICSVFFQ